MNKYNEDDEPIKKIWTIFDNIKKIAYLALDSMYTPIPFSLDLPALILNIDSFINDINNEYSPFSLTLKQLNDVVKDNVYMTGKSCLEISRSSELLLNNLEFHKDKLNTFTNLKTLFSPSHSDSELKNIFNKTSLEKVAEADWNNNWILHLKYEVDSNNYFLKNSDNIKIEVAKRQKIGTTFCRVGVNICPEKSHIYITYGLLLNINQINILKTVQKIVSDVITFENEYSTNNYIYTNNLNFLNTLTYILKSILLEDGVYKLEYSPSKNSINEYLPFFMGRGLSNVESYINNYLENIKREISKDDEHEILFMIDVLKELDIKSTFICYFGSTKVLKKGDSTETAEFDGIIYFPNEKMTDIFAVIVEAKNQCSGHTVGKHQLNDKLPKCLNANIEYNIQTIHGKGAYATLKLKNQN